MQLKSSAMVGHNSIILILLYCKMNEGSHDCSLVCFPCANCKLLQYLSKVDTITARLATAAAHLSKAHHFGENGPVLVIVPFKKDKSVLLEIFERLIEHSSRFSSVITIQELRYGVTDELQPFFLPPSKTLVQQKPNIYIIPINGKNYFQGLDIVLNTLNLFFSFNPKGIFILVKTVMECGNVKQYNIWSKFFAQMWKKNCMSVVLLLFSECDLQLTVVSGKPFSKENLCRTPETAGLRFRVFNSSDDFIELDISKTKVRNFNGCTFKAGIIPAPPFVVAKEEQVENETHYEYVGGMEMNIIEVLQQKFNLSVTLDKSNGYEINSLLRRFSNGTEVGIAADMKNHKTDFALGGVSPNYRTFYMFDFSHAYKFSSFSWYVANANIAPRWQIIFKTLSLSVWILSAALLLLVCFLYFVMEMHNYRLRKTSKFTVTSITFIELLCVGLGLSATQQPRGCSKVLFFSWAAFGLHWSMAYSTTLFDLLSNPPVEKEILTIQDLKDSGFKVVSPNLYFQLFRGVDIDSVTRSVLNNKIDCMNLNFCIKQFVTQRNVSLMDRSEHVAYSVNFKVSKIHKLSENLISFGVSLMANKGNPLSLVINEVVLHAFESGLVKKWEADTAWKFNYEKNIESFSEDISLPLSVTVLQGAFLLLIVGLSISLIMFLGEIFLYRC